MQGDSLFIAKKEIEEVLRERDYPSGRIRDKVVSVDIGNIKATLTGL